MLLVRLLYKSDNPQATLAEIKRILMVLEEGLARMETLEETQRRH